MAKASSSTHELMTQRLELLRQLAGSLEQSQAALATNTPAKLDHHTTRQQELCRELRVLAGGVLDEAHAWVPSRLVDDLQETTRRVADLSRLYGALLRRSRRTVDIFCRVLASSGTTYPAPKPPSHPDEEGAGAKE